MQSTSKQKRFSSVHFYFSEAANVPRVEEANNELTDISQPDNSYSRPFLSPLPMPQSHFSSMASQSGPIFFSANQAPPTTSQSQLSLSNQSYPLQPFALIPPMVVPFHALMQANSPNLNPNDENYMMPRIVDFGALQNRLASQMQQGFLPGFYKDCTTIDATELGKEGENNQSSLDKDPIKLDENSNNILVQESKEKSETTGNVPVGEEVSITSEPQGNNEPPKNIKLPGFAKFLECLQPQPAKDSLQDMDNRYDYIFLIHSMSYYPTNASISGFHLVTTLEDPGGFVKWLNLEPHQIPLGVG